MNYYNENDTQLVAWLRNLIEAGLLPEGDVDDRSITDVRGSDLKGYTQCHFFAGIGGWPLALDLAGWPTTRPVWTGSCPCQPFSNAGKQGGTNDPRHLFPEFRRLIAECNPPTIIGEQVASKSGRAWLAGVRGDLQTLGYGVGAADICGASIGSPHIRQRLYWVADAGLQQRGGRSTVREAEGQHGRPTTADQGSSQAGGGASGVREVNESGDGSISNGPWDGAVYIDCLDGKSRRVEPRISPLADGVPGRVVKLRAYGNAIIPQVAAEFVRAFMEIEEGRTGIR
tara:strand:+ start:971 stop:1825 length:855 start_codon:yes stop_codon:yes gene_type:complete